jgi:predicted CXXCH cytochrome family protein
MPFYLNFLARLCVVLLLGNAASAQSLSYVGSDTCADCHADQADLWKGSQHALAWTSPTPQTMLGDFNDAEYDDGKTVTRFSTREGEYFVTVTELDGQTTQYKVHSAAGIAPLQQYLLETEPGRQQSLDVVWDVEGERWYNLYPDQVLPPDDGLHWSGPYKNWNARCAECHATGYQRNYGARTGKYTSTTAEMGVGCEACHGQASAHLAWTEGQDVLADGPPNIDAYGFPIGVKAIGDQQCAACHSRRESLMGGNPNPGTPFADAYTLATLRPGLYEADGQIQDEVYVYGSFLQSKMFARGVGCVNCHNPHDAELKAEGNAVCAQCHSPAGNPDFPTLTKTTYDSPDHTFHPVGSEGGQCKNCHMPEQVYMGIDGRRDHSFRIPRPDLGAQTGAPDACTACHQGKTQDWAAAQIAVWYPDSTRRGPHYGQVLAAGRAAPDKVSGDLLTLALNEDQPGIVRATALNLLQSQANPQLAEATAPLLRHADPLIRANAAPLQRGADLQTRLTRLMPLLSDKMRSVRIATAKQLLDTPPDQLARSQGVMLNAAMGDWQKSLGNKLDFPETHLVMGGTALTLRNFPAALQAFKEVVRLDPQRADAWVMLVRLTDALDGPEAAGRVLRRAVDKVPGDPGLMRLMGQIGR